LNQELLNATYTSYKYPNSFYSENLGDTSLYYVNTLSIDSSNQWIELSTGTPEIAFNWSTLSTYENSQFTSGRQSEKYYEFIRTDNPVDNLLIKFRTHKEDYFTREGFDRTGSIGFFTKVNYESAEAKELIDYLWFTHNYDNGSSKILSSFTETAASTISVFQFELFIVYGDFNINDEITLCKNTYEIQLDNGQILKTNELITTIQGQPN